MSGTKRLALAPLRHWLLLSFCLATAAPVLAESDACALIPDDHNPSEKMLRCGDDLTIRSAADTRYRLDRKGQEPPTAVHLDAGALMIEFKSGPDRRNFQILTPHAIAAVRGTTWAVEVSDEKTATLVISGYVEVKRPGAEALLLRAGQGVDVPAGTDAFRVKRWPRPRVQALLARFGQ